jgi:1-phosphofructokinase
MQALTGGDMIYTVTFNPSLDYTIRMNHFETGEINRTENEVIFPGGKGINVSIVLHNLGCDSTAMGFLAGFTGREIERLLKEKGVAADFIYLKEGTSRINVKLVPTEGARETAINARGPVIPEECIQALYEKLDALKEGDMLVLSGSIPSSMPSDIYMDIMKHLEGKGIDIIVDATKELLTNVLPYHPFLIKPNHHELGELFHTEIRNKDDVENYGRKLQEKGARNVLVSMAGDGAVLIGESGKAYRMEAPKGKLVNSVGAGDSMVAGFLAGWTRSHNEEEAFRWGVCTGSASAFSHELASASEVEALLKQFR